MTILSRTVDPVHVSRILRDRPYLDWSLVPLAAFLVEEGYSDGARAAVIDAVAAGRSLSQLVTYGWLEPADLSGARRYLRRGRVRAARRRADRAAYDARAAAAAAADRAEMDRLYGHFDEPAPEPDPTADPDGAPVYYEGGAPAPHPVVEREPFDPGTDGDGPSPEEWEEMCEAARRDRPEFTPSGWLD